MSAQETIEREWRKTHWSEVVVVTSLLDQNADYDSMANMCFVNRLFDAYHMVLSVNKWRLVKETAHYTFILSSFKGFSL